eukprot:365713-Chlamydomonas_euryale.AAC.2
MAEPVLPPRTQPGARREGLRHQLTDPADTGRGLAAASICRCPLTGVASDVALTVRQVTLLQARQFTPLQARQVTQPQAQRSN